MNADCRLYLTHMRDNAAKAVALLGDRDRAASDADETLQLALTHLAQIVGEAASRLPHEFLVQHPELPWSAIIGMRHRVVHGYLSVDAEIVRRTVVEELPPLIRRLNQPLAAQADTP